MNTNNILLLSQLMFTKKKHTYTPNGEKKNRQEKNIFDVRCNCFFFHYQKLTEKKNWPNYSNIITLHALTKFYGKNAMDQSLDAAIINSNTYENIFHS